MGKVVFRNNEYDVSDGLLDAYEKFVGEVTEEALENLWRYHSVYRVKEIQSELPSLMGTAVYNSVLLWENGFGSIVEYNPNGEICNVFRSVDEMISATNNPSSIYGFEFFDGLKEGLTRKGIVFFGTKFKPLYDQMSWKNGSITSLNRAIKFLKRWESRAFKSYDDPFIKTQIGDISFEDFCEQYRKNYFFTLVDYFRYWKESLSEIEERVKMEEKPYKVNLENLLKRYAVNGLTKFEKADDLNVYTGQSGIYIFCLDEIRGYYIGQTTTDIKTRIKRHWSEPSNTFDRTYGPKDVSAIYILRLKTKYLNRVEQDCIANINEKYLLNGFVGGNVIAGVHSAWYNSGDYKLGQDELNEVLVGID